jgi:tryptophan 7-halogenase
MSDSGVDAPYRVVVVGGGSAGWIAASRIAGANPGCSGDRIEVHLVESPHAGPIGVGEGTWPTMRNTLAKIGVREGDFIRETDAVFKQGAKFVGWTDGGPSDAYYHPLNPPQGAGDLDLSPFWLAQYEAGDHTSFADRVDFQAMLCEAGRGPKMITTPEYRGLANYAYHLDAGKFASFLQRHATQPLGVTHHREHITNVQLNDAGEIKALDCESGASITGDLFVDCSGLAGLLIGGVYKIGLRDRRDVLFADRAVAMQVPYARDDAPIACHTISTAQSAGWIWDIGLWSRRGVGYVYSTAHITDDQAEAALRRYAGPGTTDLSARRIDINAGQRKSFWHKNCVAVGLAGGFVEPLEASSLVLTEVAVDIIASRLPRTAEAMDIVSRQFNRAFDHHWDRVVEFLKLHYLLTKRTDTEFWRDNVAPSSIPGDLRDRLAMWRDHPPTAQDFPQRTEVFSWPSYQYVMHGMNFDARYRSTCKNSATAMARDLFKRVEAMSADAVQKMPVHRQLVAAVRDNGLQAI